MTGALQCFIVSSLVKVGFLLLHDIRIMKRCLSRCEPQSNLLVFCLNLTCSNSRLDYCNSLLHDIVESLLDILQCLQAARLIFNVQKVRLCHAPSMGTSLIATSSKIDLKLVSIVNKCQRKIAPEYLAACFSPITVTLGRQHHTQQHLRQSPTSLTYH